MSLNKSPGTPNAIVKLSNLMRYVITDASVDFVPLDKEIEYLKNFIELQQIRFGSSLKLELEIEGETYARQIAPLVVMPLVENAFKYGINPEEESIIKIEITVDLTSVTFNIINKKLKVENMEHTGIGLRNVKKRLELIYPGKHALIIKDDDGIFDVKLKLS